ncbi:hypothetical protein LOC68_09780 [Blastopirellula sp. JC732]|uniref:RNA polymerase alpha subunit C-terminal domain-containing protein n=1 Tax=Blastopirellula sediminis TaxID=2894196 RepID=A0A9X1MMM5_9BACT|nr:hypothetical protein [Blastopirellula sediminis]MCC9608536.1 hypothetical protein [Blastopirellula sediminis]MCC9628687.1 hypothetical protein [Blastopirellula sediminis]
MTRITSAQAAVVARQIELQLAQGNFSAADQILSRCVEEVRLQRRELCDEYALPREVPLTRLSLEPQVLEALETVNITTVGDLQGVTYEQLLEVPAINTTRASQVRDSVRQLVRDFKTRSFEQAL